jgi:uncharacterized repeat protein (TIGR03803 family)
MAPLLLASDGNFYGTAAYGGDTANGTVFKMTPDGTLSSIYSFTGDSDGANPQSALIEVTNGVLYGTTSSGGDSQNGTVFKITTGGILTTVASFSGPDGSGPETGLTQGPDGNLYGTTTYGGTNDNGVVYRVTPAGNLEVAREFVGAPDGANPDCGLIAGSDGALYGEAEFGGAGGQGSIYRLAFASAPAPTMNPPRVANGVITISWEAVAGSSYQVQSSENLAADNWIDLGGPIDSTGGLESVTDDVTPGKNRFYRVVLGGP